MDFGGKDNMLPDDTKNLEGDGFQFNYRTLNWRVCGCVEVGNFYGSVDEIVTDLQVFERDCKVDHWGLLTATTIANQRDAIKALKQRKFEAVKRFKNPNSGNWVTVWMKLL